MLYIQHINKCMYIYIYIYIHTVRLHIYRCDYMFYMIYHDL